MLWNIRRLATLAYRTLEKAATLAAAALDTTLQEAHMEVAEIRRLTVTERSPAMEGRWTRLELESSRPESRHLASTRRSVRARSNICPTVLTLQNEAIVLLSEYKKKRDADKKEANFKTLGNNEATSDIRDGRTAYLTAENLGVKVTVLTDTGSDCSYVPRSAVKDSRKR
jgi:hypothetical protein